MSISFARRSDVDVVRAAQRLLRIHTTELSILNAQLDKRGGSFRKRNRQEAQRRRLLEVFIPREERAITEAQG